MHTFQSQVLQYLFWTEYLTIVGKKFMVFCHYCPSKDGVAWEVTTIVKMISFSTKYKELQTFKYSMQLGFAWNDGWHRVFNYHWWMYHEGTMLSCNCKYMICGRWLYVDSIHHVTSNYRYWYAMIIALPIEIMILHTRQW